MREYYLVAMIMISGLGQFCLGLSVDSHPASQPAGGDTVNEARIICANTAFGFKLLGELTRQDPGKNICISPYSVATSLAIAYNGADGKTRQAMAETLGLEGIGLPDMNQVNSGLIAHLKNLDPGIRLEVANSLWVKEGLLLQPEFADVARDFYRATVRALDFDDRGAAAIINDWVRKETQGKIDEIVENKIDRDTLLFVINAIYFKGSWAEGFNMENTTEREFRQSNGLKKRIPMMMAQSDRFLYLRGEGFQAVGLPYGTGRVSMYVFLPDQASGLKGFSEHLNSQDWEKWMGLFHQEKIIIGLPRFESEYDVKLNPALAALGMADAFGRGADFKGICPGGLFIGEVKHKTLLVVNEEGTTSASITKVVFKKMCPAVVFDRPFFYAIRDNETGTILLMGSVVEP